MKVFGFTGGTGTGKTSAMSVFTELGGMAIDADVVYHDMLVSSDAMVSEIKNAFPSAFMDGTFNRKALGDIVFNDPYQLAKLNKITHKYVYDKIAEMKNDAEKSGVKYLAIDGVEIIESGIADMCDMTVAVIAPVSQRLIRIMAREGLHMGYAAMRIAAQKPDSYYREKCDLVIENDFETREDFENECRKIFSELFAQN